MKRPVWDMVRDDDRLGNTLARATVYLTARLGMANQQPDQLMGDHMIRPKLSAANCCVMLLCAVLVFLGTAYAAAQTIKDSAGVIRAMHDRYESTWYHTVTFEQKSTTYNPDGSTKVETWYEAALLPGKLRIDFGAPAAGNGAILDGPTAYFFKNGQQASTRPFRNLLLVLGFDVYCQPPDTTAAQLQQEGIDLNKFHEETWQGEAVYVVGADKGDLKSKQFWIEKKRLLFVRLFQPDKDDASKIEDIRFADYRPAGQAVIAARVEVHRDDKLVFSEDYSNIRVNPKLDPNTFDPQQFNSTHWEKQ